ncbi:Virulence factor BrkB [Paracidovorax citrulli]|nr:Virulence factor BrkB [Paracidovorax citrulli]
MGAASRAVPVVRVSALGKWWAPAFGGWEVLAQAINAAVGFALTTVVFATIYKIMPRVSVRWHDVWLGAAITAVLFTVGRMLIGLYIGKTALASGFGAAGSLVVIFVWVYYSAQIFLMGAEFTWVYARTFGSMRERVEDRVSPAGGGSDAGVDPELPGAGAGPPR